MERLPPESLIIANVIGVVDHAHIHDEYKRIGAGIAKALQDRAGLKPDSRVLDVGCGTGRVARCLVDVLTTGSYVGFDIVKSSVDFCREAFADVPNFEFTHVDLFSQFYNSKSDGRAETFRFPFDDETFDVVWSTSLFTHMLLPGVRNYLKEMARVLKPGKRVYNTYLLLDEISEPLVIKPRLDGRTMMHPVDGGRIGYKDKPEHVVGLYKDRVLEAHEEAGLKVVVLGLTNWSGGRPHVNFAGQDAIVAEKA